MSETSEEKPVEQEADKTQKREEKRIISSLYKVQEGKIIRLRPTCERCGPGHFMADHGDRYACGRCGFTRYKPVEDNK